MQRYDLYLDGMVEHQDGDWYRADDADAETTRLRGELEEANGNIERLRNVLEQQCKEYCDWYDRNEPPMKAAHMAYRLVCIARYGLNPDASDS